MSQEDEHLVGQQAYDPHNPEMKIKDCIVMRVYSTHVDDETKEVYSYPIAHEAIDLYSLQLRSIQVSEQFHSSKSISIVPSPANLLHTGEAASSSPQLDLAHILHHAPPQAQKPGEAQPTSTPKQYAHAQPIYAHIREYDFPLHANFCNSFVLTSVLPVWGKVFHASPDAAKEGANLPEDITHACMFEVQPGILMAHSHDDAYIQGTLAKRTGCKQGSRPLWLIETARSRRRWLRLQAQALHNNCLQRYLQRAAARPM